MSDELRKRIDNSNEGETVVKNKEVFILKEFLAMNKVLVPTGRDPLGKKLGFIKIYQGKLQIHVLIPTGKKSEKGKPIGIWHRFYVVDALEEEKARNRRMNILE